MFISVTECALARRPVRARLPFRFGAVTVRDVELLTCRVRMHGERGRVTHGWSGDLLVPRWFRKDNDATPEQDADELLRAVRSAAEAFVGVGAGRAFTLWREVFAQQVELLSEDRPDLLVRGFGVAVVERALLDGVCRLLSMPFVEALKRDAFGFRPADVHPDLADWRWQQELPEPRSRVTVRHTIGMLDELRAADVAADARVGDGLPQALEEDIDAYGLSWFKIKIGAGVDDDRRRLLEIAEFFAQRGERPGFSLDGNEQYEDTAELAELLEAVDADPRGAAFLKRCAWIEQPLARSRTFEPERHRAVDRVARFAPLTLDEADASLRAFRRAMELGYRGVSIKNCKGVFRALCNFGVARATDGAFQTGEDLSNVGVLPLQQDLVTMSALGAPHVERNGHHYFRGLDHLGRERADRALAAHPDLYRQLDDGAVALRIDRGEVDISSALAASGYGTELVDLAEGFEVVVER